MEMWRELCGRFGLRRSPEACEARQGELFLQALPGHAQPAPGAVRLVGALRREGVRLGLASSSARPWIEGVLAVIGLGEAFEVVVSGDDVVRGKPDPEIFLLAAERLGVTPTACTVIEDSRHGVAAALAAGMAVVAVRTAYNADEAFTGTQRVVASLEELVPAG
ncbi:MAG: hypothetical protein AVDCRST_MAG77-2703 [uncultured Chloroflexi bacterium]|uniref:Beta-phosphoglucomutase n=1 Tax=uncultured Chloroflexota bacterium TaxID=166587 RepID=A0A6J4IWM0_9CHLR|nr:MAG: hypothetical protein AVDCRST_MAG77-2703 [uncultured Chloroflexota bacterium]